MVKSDIIVNGNKLQFNYYLYICGVFFMVLDY